MAETTTETTPTETTPTETPHRVRLSRADSHCSKEGCKRPYRAKGYCNVHYKAWRVGEMEDHRGRYKICTKEGCKKPRFLGSLCQEHSAKEKEAAS